MSGDSIVSLNVGGTTFQTRAENMVKFPDSQLAKMSKPGKVFFLDHNPKYFEVILDYLRYGKVMNFCDENFFNGVHTLAKDLELMGVLLLKLEVNEDLSITTLKSIFIHSNSEDLALKIIADLKLIHTGILGDEIVSSPDGHK